MRHGAVIVLGLMVVAVMLASGCTTAPGTVPKGVGDPCTFSSECSAIDCNQDTPVCENGQCTCPWSEVPVSQEDFGLAVYRSAFENFEINDEKPNIAFNLGGTSGESEGLLTATWSSGNITINIISHATEDQARARYDETFGLIKSIETTEPYYERTVSGVKIIESGSVIKYYFWTHDRYYFMINDDGSGFFQNVAEKAISVYQ